MTAYTELQARLRAEPKTWLVTGVAGFIGSDLLAVTMQNPVALKQVHNFTLRCRTSLNDLHKLIVGSMSQQVFLPPAKLSYRAFRESDVRHSVTHNSKAKNSPSYISTIRVGDSVRAAITWYVSKVGMR